MMSSNSRGFGQPARRAHADLIRLPGRRGRSADLSGGDLHVLLAQRVDDIAGRQSAAGELVRIEPQAHRELALAEDDDVADARHALELVPDEAIDVVADEQRVVLVVLGVDAGGEHEVPVVTS